MASAMEFILKGKMEMESLRFQDAEISYRNALAADPSSIDARLGLARMLAAKPEIESSSILLHEILNVNPDHAEALSLLAILKIQEKKFLEAIELLERAKTLQPGLEMIYFNLARSYRKSQKYEDAESIARKGLEQFPRNHLLRSELGYLCARKGDLQKAVEYVTQSVQIQPLFWKGYLILAQLHLALGDGKKALEVYRDGLRQNPHSFVLRESLCTEFARSQDYAAAYREAAILATTRNHYRDYLLLGTLAVMLGNVEKAEKAFKKSLEINPKSWEGHFNLGELYSAAKLYSEAKKEYQLALDKNDKSFKPPVAMGMFLLQYEKDHAAAVKHFERGVELAPERLEPLLGLAVACVASRDSSRAQQLLQKAVTLSTPEDPNRIEAERLLRSIQHRVNN